MSAFRKVIICILLCITVSALFSSERGRDSLTLKWTWEQEGETDGFLYRIYDWDEKTASEWIRADVNEAVTEGLEEKGRYVLEVKSVKDGELSSSAIGIWPGRKSKWDFSFSLLLGNNVKVFPYAVRKGLESGVYSTVLSAGIGFDALYDTSSFLSFGIDSVLKATGYTHVLKSNPVQLSLEMMGEVRFSFGDDIYPIKKTWESDRFLRRSGFSFLIGGALYTDFRTTNLFVPGLGMKAVFDIYSESSVTAGIFVRATAFCFNHSDMLYSVLDISTVWGIRLGWRGDER